MRRILAVLALALGLTLGVGAGARPASASALDYYCVYVGPYYQPARWGVGEGYWYYVETCWFDGGGWY